MTETIVTLDVREDLREGRQPCNRIMDAIAALQPAQALLLIAPFEPVPLYGVLGRQGFSHSSKATADGDWEVLFSPVAAEQQPAAVAPDSGAVAAPAAQTKIELDLRGLEPPQPMVAILEAVSSLGNETVLCARTDRRPFHLYPKLQERGFTADTEPAEDGSFLTLIRRRPEEYINGAQLTKKCSAAPGHSCS